MSDSAMGLLVEIDNPKDIQNILDMFHSKFPEYKESDWGLGRGKIDMELVTEVKDGYICIDFRGRDDCDFYAYCESEFKTKFSYDFYAAKSFEGDDAYLSFRVNGIEKRDIRVTRGKDEDPYDFWDKFCPDSKYLVENARDWAIERKLI